MWRVVLVSAILVIRLMQVRSDLPETRVVNGTDASNGEFPFIASLRRVFNVTGGSHSCGCSIISREWLLTAAHCVKGRSPSDINIQYGVTDITSTGPTVATVKAILVHEGYSPSNNYIHDIALVQLAVPLIFDKFTNAVQLPQPGQFTKGGTPALLIGWGLNSSSAGIIQTHLQKVELITFSDDDCRKLHNGDTHPSNICAGVPGGGKGQCNGDSGGPLLVDGRQVGIVSWSIKPCTIAPYPGVLTKVSSYIGWIANNTGIIIDNFVRR